MLVQAFENLASSIASPRSLMRQASLMLPIDSEEADLQKPHGLAWKNSRKRPDMESKIRPPPPILATTIPRDSSFKYSSI